MYISPLWDSGRPTWGCVDGSRMIGMGYPLYPPPTVRLQQIKQYVYIHIYIYTYRERCVYIYIHVCIYIYIYLFIYLFIYV